MLLRLLLILTVVPVTELVLILRVHEWISSNFGSGLGLLLTLGTIFVTGVVGANLARSQGLGVLREANSLTNSGQLPTSALLDGIMILIGGALLLTPGYLTDAFGFSLLIPMSRAFYRRSLKTWLEQKIQSGQVMTNIQFGGFQQTRGPGAPDMSSKRPSLDPDVIDIEAEDITPR